MTQLLPWAQNNPVAFIAISLVLVYFLKELLLRQLSSKRGIFYILLFPGVIIHEISHTIGCMATLTRVKSFKLFSTSGGFVKHEEPGLPIIGILIISLAPLVIGITIIYLIVVYKLKVIAFSSFDLKTTPIVIFYLYLTLAIIITMLPSSQDIRNSAISLALVLAALIAFQSKIAPYINSLIFLVGFCLILLIVVNILMVAINRFIR